MITKLTHYDVLAYVYNEEQKKEDENKVYNDILTNEETADEFVKITEAKTLLDKCSYSASSKTLEKILKYSKKQIKESAH